MIKTYKIKAGHHYCSMNWRFFPHFGVEKISKDIIFHESCYYNSHIHGTHINKLFGLSFGHHHENSIRVGWRPNRNEIGKISIFAYTYSNGFVDQSYVTYVKVGLRFNIVMGLNYKMDEFSLKISNNTSITPKQTWAKQYDFSKCKMKCGYMLFPYFGGKPTAPYDMSIDMADIK